MGSQVRAADGVAIGDQVSAPRDTGLTAHSDGIALGWPYF